MFGKNLESACKAQYYRETIRLQDAAEDAATKVDALPVGSPEWIIAAKEAIKAQIDLQNHLCQIA